MSHHLIGWHLRDAADWQSALARSLHYGAGDARHEKPAAGRAICLMFFNPSLRTRTSMEVAAAQLGAHVTSLSPGSGTWHMAFEDGVVMDGQEAEHIQEAAGVLSRYYDAIGVRVFASLTDYEQDRSERLINRFVRAASVPVINLESAFWHPCQELADASVITEHFGGDASGRTFVLSWCYHPKALPMAVPNSAVTMAARLGMHVTVVRPDGYELDDGVMKQAQSYAQKSGGSVSETDDRVAAFDGASVVYAKAWSGRGVYEDSVGEASRRAALREWRVTSEVMRRTDDGVFMHCLPVRRNVVVDDAVLDGPAAIHLRQAEYRLYAQKAILEKVWDLSPE